MCLHNIVLSLQPAALLFTLGLALLPLAQTDIEPTLKASETRGLAGGIWLPAGVDVPGWMHGAMLDERGHLRFELDAITHRIAPSEVPGYEVGTLYGRMLCPRLQDAPSDKPPSKDQIEHASISLLGRWAVNESTGAGRFVAVAYVEFDTLPMPLVLLDIGGVFRQRPATTTTVKLGFRQGEHAGLPENLGARMAALCAKGESFAIGDKLASIAGRISADAEDVAVTVTDGSPAVRFHARWMTRD